MKYERYQIVRCKITSQKMIIKDVINKDYSDEKYNCKYHNRANGLYEYVHKMPDELEAFDAIEIGFKNEPAS
jgi:hypothetical protein